MVIVTITIYKPVGGRKFQTEFFDKKFCLDYLHRKGFCIVKPAVVRDIISGYCAGTDMTEMALSWARTSYIEACTVESDQIDN